MESSELLISHFVSPRHNTLELNNQEVSSFNFSTLDDFQKAYKSNVIKQPLIRPKEIVMSLNKKYTSRNKVDIMNASQTNSKLPFESKETITSLCKLPKLKPLKGVKGLRKIYNKMAKLTK